MSYQKKEHETLCWTCRYACSDLCSWAGDFEPVPGWKAIETKKGFDVYECPLYQEGRGLRRNMSNEGTMLLLEAMANQMRDDYIHGRDIREQIQKTDNRYKKMTPVERAMENANIRAKNRQTIEKWLMGDGGNILQISNPQEVIRMLRKFAAKYEQERANALKGMNWL